MDSNESMTFTSITLILLLLIIIVMFACHFLGPRATTWMRSNREEKIGLSKNKLFHSNGYMLPSGSTFLLNNSSNFKRFDINEKKDTTDSAKKISSTHATTPFWSFPQENTIPPQPLRPAPAPGKTVSFALSKVNEFDLNKKQRDNEDLFVPCLPAKVKSTSSSKLVQIEAPPPPRLFPSMTAPNSSAAIPRPMARRYISQDKFHEENQHIRMLTRRNSSTNPFLCDSIDNGPMEKHNEICTALDSQEDCTLGLDIKKSLKNNSSIINGNEAQQAKELNPFLDQQDDNEIPFDDHNFSTLVGEIGNENKVFFSDNRGNKRVEANSQLIDKTVAQSRFRVRSFSEVGCSPVEQNTAPSTTVKGLESVNNVKSNPFNGLAKKSKRTHLLQKTFSEDFLFRRIASNSLNTHPNSINGENGTWTFGSSLLRQNSLLSLKRRNSSQGSLDSNESVEELERAISCDSVNSDSVFLCDLDQPYTQITGYLCIGLNYDSISNEGFDLIVTVNEAKGLIPPFNVNSLDTFVRIYLVPDTPGAMQTQVIQNSQTPRYNESFTFWLKKQNGRHSLWFHVYHNGDSHTLIGEAEMEIHEAPRTITTWIPLSDSRKRNAQWGELMFSLSYLPTAERLTIVVVKARNLKLELDSNVKPNQLGENEIQSVFVKVYLMNNERKVLKKRTSLKRRDRSIVFNESMIFSVPPQGLMTVQLRLTVYGVVGNTIYPLGHVIAGSCATGKGLRHWHQMLSSLRKPVSMWHVLRRAINQPVFSGGAEAVVAALQSTSLRSKRNSVI